MKRALSAGAALTLLALPAGATAKPTGEDRTNAAQECRAERGGTTETREAFRAKFGTNANGRNAFGKCVSRKSAAEERQRKAARANAAKECDAERTADPTLFATTYGTNKNGKNAYGKCVSQKAKENKAEADAQDAEKIKQRKAAAKECGAERSADPTGFANTYGKNANKRNAFGKCVSQKAKA